MAVIAPDTTLLPVWKVLGLVGGYEISNVVKDNVGVTEFSLDELVLPV